MAKILVVGPSWVGDMVMAQSLFIQLTRQDPSAQIAALAPPWSRPILARMPEVHAAIDMPVGHGRLALGARYQLAKSLRNQGYTQAILLPNSLKSALIPFWAKIPKRTGFRGELRYGLLNDIHVLDRQRLTMTVQRFVSLANPPNTPLPEPLAPPALQVDPESVAQCLARFSLCAPETPILGLCPGAEYGPAKRWPVEHFIAVAQAKRRQGWAIWLFGSEKDAAITAQIQQGLAGECVDLAGRTRLADAVDLLSLCSTVLSNDSGLMHVAAALGCKVLALYGSSDPGFTPPLSERATVLSLNLDCSPCFKRECPLGHLKCLRDLSPERVLRAMEE